MCVRAWCVVGGGVCMHACVCVSVYLCRFYDMNVINLRCGSEDVKIKYHQ